MEKEAGGNPRLFFLGTQEYGRDARGRVAGGGTCNSACPAMGAGCEIAASFTPRQPRPLVAVVYGEELSADRYAPLRVVPESSLEGAEAQHVGKGGGRGEISGVEDSAKLRVRSDEP